MNEANDGRSELKVKGLLSITKSDLCGVVEVGNDYVSEEYV